MQLALCFCANSPSSVLKGSVVDNKGRVALRGVTKVHFSVWNKYSAKYGIRKQ